MRGRCVRPSCNGMVRCARASTGRCSLREWGGDLCTPIEGEVHGGETSREVSGRVLGSEGGEGGE